MLQAIVPQVAEMKSKVELIILDNASTDETADVANIYNQTENIIYLKNVKNIGVIGNIVKCAKDLAKGEFTWILGDHNLLLPNSLNDIVSIIEQRKKLDIFYVNFRCAKYPEQWPEKAHLGHDGEFEYFGNRDIKNKKVNKWQEFISIESGLCTQLYAHIIKTNVWKSYWNNRDIPETFKSGIGTYPHTYMIAEILFNSPSFYIGKPLITIFNGAQHWKDERVNVYFYGLTELIELFKKKGLSIEKQNQAVNWHKNQILNCFKVFFFNLEKEENKLTSHYKIILSNSNLMYWTVLGYLKYSPSRFPNIIRIFQKKNRKLFDYFKRWRPARWLNQLKKIN